MPEADDIAIGTDGLGCSSRCQRWEGLLAAVTPVCLQKQVVLEFLVMKTSLIFPIRREFYPKVTRGFSLHSDEHVKAFSRLEGDGREC